MNSPVIEKEPEATDREEILPPKKFSVVGMAPGTHDFCGGAVKRVFRSVFGLDGLETQMALQDLDQKGKAVLKTNIVRELAEHYVANAVVGLISEAGGCDCRTASVVSFQIEEAK
jgi:hypothetical protein